VAIGSFFSIPDHYQELVTVRYSALADTLQCIYTKSDRFWWNFMEK